MTLFDFIKIAERDFDVYDDVFDAEVTVCHIEENKHNDFYDKFCIGIIKKVNLVNQTSEYTLVAKWTKLIQDNMDKFREFTNKHWNKKYKNDEEEFIYQWINEIHLYMAGYVSEDFYETLVEFVDSLEFKEE